ncbi:hypothetical protein AHAS_Ahas13G0143600 [Arachis hypogaea]
MFKYSRAAHFITIIRDDSFGKIKIEWRRYELDDSDRENMKEGLKQTLQILIVMGAGSNDHRIKCEGKSVKELREFVESVYVTGGRMSHEEKWSVYS